MKRCIFLAVLLATLLAPACAAPDPGGRSPAAEGEQGRASPKRVMAVIAGDPPFLYQQLNPAGVRGSDALEELLNAGLAQHTANGSLRPQLAEAVPTIENGLWKIFPDGRMETSWTLKPTAQWHDGAAFSVDDLLFTARVSRDRDLPDFGDVAYDAIEAIEGADAWIIRVLWKQPFIGADAMFTSELAMPMPRHLLEPTYTDDKPSFLHASYWTQDFIGTGPFKLRQWVKGSHVRLIANDHYVLGRPRIDEIEVKLIPDRTTLVANVLAGSAELLLGRGLSLEEGIQARDQWRDGRLELSYDDWFVIYPQFVNPNPAVVADVRFRRALLHAIDRQQLVDALVFGQSFVADSFVSPNTQEGKAIEGSIVRYEYDPGKAAAMLEGLGYQKGADGLFVSRGADRLVVEINTTAQDANTKPMFAVAEYWKTVGVGVETVIIPQQLVQDREYRATFPAFALQGQPNNLERLRGLHSSEARLPERRFTGSNNARYMNPALDALVEQFFATIHREPRMRVLAQIAHLVTNELVWLGLYYRTDPNLIGNRLVNVGPKGQKWTQAWNAEQWDLRR